MVSDEEFINNFRIFNSKKNAVIRYLLRKINNFDIIICCPHLNIYVKQLLEKTDVQVPIYILPPRMYGNMEIEEIYQDVIDLLEIYQQTHMNPVHFPGEENVLKITRQNAYKHVYQK